MTTDSAELERFSDPSLLILSSLAGGPKHGYAISKDIEAFAGSRSGRRPSVGPWEPGADRANLVGVATRPSG